MKRTVVEVFFKNISEQKHRTEIKNKDDGSLTAFTFTLLVLTRVAHMHRDVIRRRNGPLEIESESQVVIVGGEFPEYESTVFMSRNSNLNM